MRTKRLFVIGAFAFILTSENAWAVDFETIRNNMKGMTSVAWSDYTKSLQGQKVNWSGWVADVKQQWLGGYKILVDMDPPKTISVQDVYLEDIDKDVATRFGKGEHVRFSGTIKSVTYVFGACAVNLGGVTISK